MPIVGLIVVAGLAGVLYSTRSSNSASPSEVPIVINVPAAEQSNKTLSIDELSHGPDTKAADSESRGKVQLDELEAEIQTAHTESNSARVTEAIRFAQSIALERLDDATINEQAEVLRNDPVKLSAVLDEFSAEADAERLSRLRLLLGQLDDPSLVSVAESMIFSGNPVSSKEALKLLRDIGPRVSEAQEVGVSLLSSTQDPNLLVGATNILNNSTSADSKTRESVVTSLSSLVQHPDATVRRASFSSLARWSKDPSNTPTLLQGLSDSDPSVRKSTAYGLVGYPHADASVISALLNTAENVTETRRARSGAMLALKSMSLNDSQSARLQAVQSQL